LGSFSKLELANLHNIGGSMSGLSRLKKAVLIAALGGTGAIAGVVLLAGGPKTTIALIRSKESGGPRIVSIQPLREAGGPECEWVPASFRGEALLPATDDMPSDSERIAASKRKPVRVIRDPYSSYSSVAVDPVHNEVVLTDESLFNIMVYDRQANTPASASMTEPKRMIGGLNTKIEFQCGLYIDPSSGDIYAVNNDTVDTLVIFSRQAKGNVPPDRDLHTPHGTYGIAVDEEKQELFLTVQHDSAIVVYPKMAKKEDAPVRLLQGDKTMLADPHGIAIDAKSRLMFVTNHGSVHQNHPGDRPDSGSGGGGLPGSEGKPNWPSNNSVAGSGRNLPPSINVYALDARGDTAPLRVIQGPLTQMDWPTGIVFDSQRNELYVANDMGNSVLVFSATADGNATPIRVLKGPKTLIKYPTGVFVDGKNDELWVTNFGNHTATVYKPTAAGDTAPLRTIRSSPPGTEALDIGNPGALAYDSKREQILTPN
jgi:DNA-binding beta-propeller fold protein YncE